MGGRGQALALVIEPAERRGSGLPLAVCGYPTVPAADFAIRVPRDSAGAAPRPRQPPDGRPSGPADNCELRTDLNHSRTGGQRRLLPVRQRVVPRLPMGGMGNGQWKMGSERKRSQRVWGLLPGAVRSSPGGWARRAGRIACVTGAVQGARGRAHLQPEVASGVATCFPGRRMGNHEWTRMGANTGPGPSFVGGRWRLSAVSRRLGIGQVLSYTQRGAVRGPHKRLPGDPLGDLASQ